MHLAFLSQIINFDRIKLKNDSNRKEKLMENVKKNVLIENYIDSKVRT